MRITATLSASPVSSQTGLVATLSLLLVCSLSGVFGQAATAPSPTGGGGQGAVGSADSSASGGGVAAGPSFLQWGPVDLRPRASYQLVSSTGLRSSLEDTSDSITQSMSVGATASIGRHWTLDYQPSWTVYSSDDFSDTVSHSASLAGHTDYQEWNAQFEQSFDRSSQPRIETGQQTKEERHGTSATIQYRLGSTVSLETNLSQQLSYTSGFNDTKAWNVMEWIHARMTPELDFAVGGGGGYVEVNNGPDTSSQQLKAKADYRTGPKLNLHAEVGLDRRKTTASTSKWEATPIAAVQFSYQASLKTAFSVGASRAVSVSYFTRQSTRTDTVNFGFHQRLYRSLSLSASAGYNHAAYRPDDGLAGTRRRDNSRSFDVSLSAAATQRISGSVFYGHTENDSNETGYGLSSDRVGLSVGYHY